MPQLYLYEDGRLRALDAPSTRPLRWAAWRPDGACALLAGNRGEAWRLDGKSFDRLDAGTTQNLRGIGWSPDGGRALICGNRGALLSYDGRRFEHIAAPTVENLRRVAWSPDGSCALVIGNAGAVLRLDAATGDVVPVPGDRAHTLRSVGWRPDGAYALVGGYASRYAGYPRPAALYRCDGRYLQAMLATDEEDDAVAISWRDGAAPRALIAMVVAPASANAAARNKLVEYDGSGYTTRELQLTGAVLGAAWRPDGAYALIAGERGALVRYDGARTEAVDTGMRDNLVGPFWHPSSDSALLLRGPQEKTYTV